MRYDIRGEVHTFANFELDAQARLLRYQGEPVKLEALAIELWILIIQQKSVTTTQIVQHFWDPKERGTRERINVKIHEIYRVLRERDLAPEHFFLRNRTRTTWVWRERKAITKPIPTVHLQTMALDDPRASRFTKLYQTLRPRFSEIVIDPKSDSFLNYSPNYLLNVYEHERPILDGVPYVSPYDCRLATTVSICESGSHGIPFALEASSPIWLQTSQAGYSALFRTGRIKENEDIVRVERAEVKDGNIRLHVRAAKYHHQARSNLILDFNGELSEHTPLRQQLLTERPGLLPELSDNRLANTLGVAALLFYLDNTGQLVPYLVKRVPKVGVFPGGIHLTASGAAKWPASPADLTLATIATNHVLAELKEEVGLEPSHLIDFAPVAFCREMTRGGKPQLFYAGITMLTREELRNKRVEAVRTIKATQSLSEIQFDTWKDSADVVFSAEDAETQISGIGITLEAAAGLHFSHGYLNARLRDLVLPA